MKVMLDFLYGSEAQKKIIFVIRLLLPASKYRASDRSSYTMCDSNVLVKNIDTVDAVNFYVHTGRKKKNLLIDLLDNIKKKKKN